jgi:hypothetical protein
MNFSHKKLPDLSISYLSFLREEERGEEIIKMPERGEFSRSG